jgi:vacuolar-type H+-ATPase subunit E/Vma4
MPLEDLLARLGQDADAQAAAVVAGARAQAEAIRQAAETECAAERTARLGIQEAVLRAEAGAEVERVRREATRALLGERRAVLDRILARVGELLPAAIASPAYLDSVDAELDRALEIAGTGGAVLRATPAIASRIAARDLRGVDVLPDAGVTGFRLEGAGGRLVVDATLPARLRRRTPELTIAAARALEEAP